MLKIAIDDDNQLELANLVLDFNGTLAIDGKLIDGVKSGLEKLREHLDIHIVTADTFGTVQKELPGYKTIILKATHQAEQKAEFVLSLGSETCVCIGNGYNDRLMLEISRLGIAIIQAEGAHVKTLLAADLASTDILDALEMLINRKRLRASMRN